MWEMRTSTLRSSAHRAAFQGLRRAFTTHARWCIPGSRPLRKKICVKIRNSAFTDSSDRFLYRIGDTNDLRWNVRLRNGQHQVGRRNAVLFRPPNGTCVDYELAVAQGSDVGKMRMSH